MVGTDKELTRTQRKRLAEELDSWTKRDSDWKAGIVFLRLEELGLVEWEPNHGGCDVRTGPGHHGGGWLTRRTAKGSLSLSEKSSSKPSRIRFTIFRPFPAPSRFSVRGARIGVVVLQSGLQIRRADRSAWVVMAWRNATDIPYYLTPDGRLWLNGLDGKEWLHESFSVFPSQELAKAAGDSQLRGPEWKNMWKSMQFAQVRISKNGAHLVPVEAGSDLTICPKTQTEQIA